MTFWRYLLALALAAILLVAVPILTVSYLSHTIRSVDLPVHGLIEPIASGKTVHLVVIHGIGKHCIGYSKDLMAALAKDLGLTAKNEPIDTYSAHCRSTGLEPGQYVGPQMQLLHNQQNFCRELYDRDQSCHEIFFDGTLGFIRTLDFTIKAGENTPSTPTRLHLYEVVWDPTTRWAKESYVQYLDHIDDDQRTFFNREGKWKLINEAITDAVLYLGDYKVQMQFAVFMGFCKIMIKETTEKIEVTKMKLDETSGPFRNRFVCVPQTVSEAFSEHNYIAVISHSLGTRMVFDTLGLVSDPVSLLELIKNLKIPVPNITLDTLENVTRGFNRAMGSIYAFANQIPLIELGMVTKREDFVNTRAIDSSPPPPADLGTRFQRFLDRRLDKASEKKAPKDNTKYVVGPLQVVAFTDHDDFLSYNLKCWYYLNVIRFHKRIVAMRKQYLSKSTEMPSKLEFKVCEAGGEKEFWDLVRDQITVSNVIVRLGFYVPWVFANPIGAHGNYWIDDEVHHLIACGTAENYKGEATGGQVTACVN
jgi:hypothetical protein